jgi:hypothetical protein
MAQRRTQKRQSRAPSRLKSSASVGEARRARLTVRLTSTFTIGAKPACGKARARGRVGGRAGGRVSSCCPGARRARPADSPRPHRRRSSRPLDRSPALRTLAVAPHLARQPRVAAAGHEHAGRGRHDGAQQLAHRIVALVPVEGLCGARARARARMEGEGGTARRARRERGASAVAWFARGGRGGCSGSGGRKAAARAYRGPSGSAPPSTPPVRIAPSQTLDYLGRNVEERARVPLRQEQPRARRTGE